MGLPNNRTNRQATHLHERNIAAFETEGDPLLERKVTLEGDDYLRSLTTIFGEWTSPEDEKAWRSV